MKLHVPTALATLGVIGLVAVLSAQSTISSPRVTVDNPLGVPGWVPSDVWMARYGYNQQTGQHDHQDYTVPAGHFALVRTLSGNASGGDFAPHIDVDEGSGFYQLSSMGTGSDSYGVGGGNFEPGIVIDEGTVIRANAPRRSPRSGWGRRSKRACNS